MPTRVVRVGAPANSPDTIGRSSCASISVSCIVRMPVEYRKESLQMSSPMPGPAHQPLIALVDRLNRALQAEMVVSGRAAGFPELKHAHNGGFGTLSSSQGSHTTDMATRAGITRQSMGEIVRDLVDLGIVEMTVDPEDRRAKLVTYTEYG